MAARLAAQEPDPDRAGFALGGRRPLPEQRPAAAELFADRQRAVRRPAQRRAAGQGRHLPDRAAQGLPDRHRPGLCPDHPGGVDPGGPRLAEHPDLDVQPVAGHRPAAPGPAVVRPGGEQPDFRAGAFGALGPGSEHLRRVSRGFRNPAHGRAQLRAQGHALRAVHPDPGGAAVDPRRPENRLGLRLAHPDRRRTGVRRHQRQGRPGLVHLPEPQRAVHRQSLRRPGGGDPDRPAGGKPGVRHPGAGHSKTLGHATLNPPVAAAELARLRSAPQGPQNLAARSAWHTACAGPARTPSSIAACGSGYTERCPWLNCPPRSRSRCRAREAAIALGGTPSQGPQNLTTRSAWHTACAGPARTSSSIAACGSGYRVVSLTEMTLLALRLTHSRSATSAQHATPGHEPSGRPRRPARRR
ncbi:hypothetical protein EMIT0P201_30010 [Pseudomonas chlororaphis]